MKTPSIIILAAVFPLAAFAGPLDKKTDNYVSPLSAPAKQIGAKPGAPAQANTLPIPAGEERRIKGNISGRTNEGVFVTITDAFVSEQHAAYRAKMAPVLAAKPTTPLPPAPMVMPGETVYVAPFRDGFARTFDGVVSADAAGKPLNGSTVRAFTKK